MAFSKEEKEELLKVKFVGETVIKRFEQIGIDSLEKLSNSSVEEITDIVSYFRKYLLEKLSTS